jgi:hypothetical protein
MEVTREGRIGEPSGRRITLPIVLFFYLKTGRFGDWILPKSSGRTYSDGPNRRSDCFRTDNFVHLSRFHFKTETESNL